MWRISLRAWSLVYVCLLGVSARATPIFESSFEMAPALPAFWNSTRMPKASASWPAAGAAP